MRKSILSILAFVLLVSAACNFPLKKPSSFTFPTVAPVQPTRTAQASATPAPVTPTPTASPTPVAAASQDGTYTVQSGDTLAAVAAHFGVTPDQIHADQPFPSRGLLPNGVILSIPPLSGPTSPAQPLLPDAEIVNSPCGQNFNVADFINGAAGKLKSYTQSVNGQTLTGAQVVSRVAAELSVNPHFLLAFIQFRSGWVLGNAGSPDGPFPLGLNISGYTGLYLELSLSAKLLNMGYYGWRGGTMTDLPFPDGSAQRIAPGLNAGSVALQYLFARLYPPSGWDAALYGPQGFLAAYQTLFGDPDACATALGPLFPDGLQPPVLELPFAPGEDWALTGGLHEDWNTGTPAGALDFAPITGETPCAVSRAWVLASAPGAVTRSADGAVQEALVDAGGNPTGWDLLYMHVAAQDRAPVGAILHTNDRIGHPSCEGGVATGTNLHITRLYRGEWIAADDAFPFVLSGWLALPAQSPYHSMLVKGDLVIVSDPNGSQQSRIAR